MRGFFSYFFFREDDLFKINKLLYNIVEIKDKRKCSEIIEEKPIYEATVTYFFCYIIDEVVQLILNDTINCYQTMHIANNETK